GTGIVKQSMFICRFLIVVQRDYRMSVYMSWTFYGPVFQFFALKTAGVANPVLHFVILIFAGRHADDFFALHPQYSFPGAFVTGAGGIHGFGKPYAAGKTGGSVC